MTINVDLLGLACAEYCEHNGVKGIFIPEVPNFRYVTRSFSYKKTNSALGIVTIQLLKAKPNKKYDWTGRQMIPPEHLDAYLSNPNTVNRRRLCAYGKNFGGKENEECVSASTASDFDRLLDE